MQPHIRLRIAELLVEGGRIVSATPQSSYWVSEKITTQAWITSTANLIQQITPPRSHFQSELARILSAPQLVSAIPSSVPRKLLGVLMALDAEVKSGLLQRFEYQIVASAFDEFLDHAGAFHRAGKLREAAVLASAVLEDSIKRLANRKEVNSEGLTLEPLIDKLVAAEALTQVQAKRLKAQVAVRNHALHAEWDKLDLRDVGLQIQAIRDLIEQHLQ